MTSTDLSRRALLRRWIVQFYSLLCGLLWLRYPLTTGVRTGLHVPEAGGSTVIHSRRDVTRSRPLWCLLTLHGRGVRNSFHLLHEPSLITVQSIHPVFGYVLSLFIISLISGSNGTEVWYHTVQEGKFACYGSAPATSVPPVANGTHFMKAAPMYPDYVQQLDDEQSKNSSFAYPSHI